MPALKADFFSNCCDKVLTLSDWKMIGFATILFNNRANRMKTIATFAFFLSASMLSGVSSAGVVSSSSISNLVVELVDLNPTDGIDPSIFFSHRSDVWAGVATTAGNGFDSYAWDHTFSQSPSITSTNGARGAFTTAFINGQHLGTNGGTDGEGEYYGSALQTSMFSLSANTQLIVRGHANATAVGNLVDPEYSSGWLSVQIIDSQRAHPFNQISFYSTSAYTYNNGPRLIDETFTLTFENTGLSTLYGTMDLSVGASGMVAPVSVSEPGTLSILLGGVTLLGAMTYRRRNPSAKK